MKETLNNNERVLLALRHLEATENDDDETQEMIVDAINSSDSNSGALFLEAYIELSYQLIRLSRELAELNGIEVEPYDMIRNAYLERQ